MRPLATIELDTDTRRPARGVICLDGREIIVLDPMSDEPRREEWGVENLDQAIDYIELSWRQECWDLQWLVDLDELGEVLS